MGTIWWILIVLVALIGGVVIGYFVTKQSMLKYLEENPPINEDMLRMMMMQMGQKPSQSRLNQMMKQMNKVDLKKETKKQKQQKKK